MRKFYVIIVIATNLNLISTSPLHSHQKPNHQPSIEKTKREQRAPNYIYQHVHNQYLATNLHVIPLQNVFQNQVSHSHNRTTQLIPIYSYLPLHHNYFVPIQDLQVIPLGRSHISHSQNVPQSRSQINQNQKGHYRMMESRNDDGNEQNRFRTFYGGYGQGLYFGGHGAGHGFYVYG